MSILSDLFVTDADDAQLYEKLQSQDQFPIDRFERAQFKGLTDLEFTTLWALVQNEEWDIDQHSLEVIGVPGDTWLFKFPSLFVDSLSSLDQAGISRVSPLWAATEEMEWEPSEAQEVIEELVRLAKFAKSNSKGLYLWGSV